tara:strand:- start:303 stop:494 length:192 start_codon:yes stop_codon:yes gene_type:complete
MENKIKKAWALLKSGLWSEVYATNNVEYIKAFKVIDSTLKRLETDPFYCSFTEPCEYQKKGNE